MATIAFSVPHGLGRQGAEDRLRAAANANRSVFGSYVKSETWSEGKVDVAGPGFSGTCLIGEREIAVSIDLGFLLRPFKGRIEREARERLAGILGSG